MSTLGVKETVPTRTLTKPRNFTLDIYEILNHKLNDVRINSDKPVDIPAHSSSSKVIEPWDSLILVDSGTTWYNVNILVLYLKTTQYCDYKTMTSY